MIPTILTLIVLACTFAAVALDALATAGPLENDP